MTVNTYSHVAPEVSREAAERMTQMLWENDDEDGADDQDQTDDDQADDDSTKEDGQ